MKIAERERLRNQVKEQSQAIENALNVCRADENSFQELEQNTKIAQLEIKEASTKVRSLYPKMQKQMESSCTAVEPVYMILQEERRKKLSKLLEMLPCSSRTANREGIKILNLVLPENDDYSAVLRNQEVKIPVVRSTEVSVEATSVIATALGNVSLLLKTVSLYLDIPLLYPITICGSRSVITAGKDYPLYGEGPDADFTEARRLLYHNIQHLCFLQGYLVHDETKALLHLQSLLKTHELGKEGPYPFTSMTGSGFIASSAA
eukprot:CAMPEP_0206191000 /NCGR_PEP_ID=MMETSP0166-20121206/5090_1 /ASSEMBLY_ACC=CAM_ASM_000260 /TAXON_ID=95228 /ORGANISM="Vannella robusta, Strain DIVA3 518/3/11/1/6" /LENGTH=262 /DNA_ID=CAMNT_0053607197 /DNA_START=284 /DNA_END=1069 /DNA_ORIENTATION=+